MNIIVSEQCCDQADLGTHTENYLQVCILLFNLQL